MLQLEVLIAEKDEKLKFVATELEITQKTLRLLNNGKSIVDHLITSSKFFGDHNGIGYKGKSSSKKLVFVKSRLQDI